MKTRRRHTFHIDVQELEGRLLQAGSRLAAAWRLGHDYLNLVGPVIPGMPSQFATQQAGTVTLTLSRIGNLQEPLQVEVKDDPSPVVGVNVGAVDQTVTFASGVASESVSVPILAGPTNPGEVSVTFTATPINPPIPTQSTSLVLQILKSSAWLPATVATDQGTAQGIVLTFNKPMNPAAASNVDNYAVRETLTSQHTTAGDSLLGILTLPGQLIMGGKGSSNSISTRSGAVPLKAAEYDPATNSVTLVPKRRLNYSMWNSITVTQGPGTKTSSVPGSSSDAPLGLTDLEGNPINWTSSPGRFRVWVMRQKQTVGSSTN